MSAQFCVSGVRCRSIEAWRAVSRIDMADGHSADGGGSPRSGGAPWHTVRVFDVALLGVLEESQRLGFLGDRDLVDVIDHARAFVDALVGVEGTVADMGSGGGIPGLVIAHDRPDLQLLLVDRRAKRTDFLDRMVRRLRWGDRVTVVCADVEAVIGADRTIDAAVARGFGPPGTTLSMASRLVRPEGRIIISEPPTGDRWSAEWTAELGVRRIDEGRGDEGKGSVSIFER